MELQLEKSQNSYSNRLEFLSLSCSLLAASLAILGTIGHGQPMKEICFSPSKKSVCKLDKVATIPEPYFVANEFKSSNPNYNDFAFLGSRSTKVIRRITPDNPYKTILSGGAIVFGVATLVFTSKLREKLVFTKYHFTSTVAVESYKAGVQFSLNKELLDYSASELIKYLKPLKSANAKIDFLRNISPTQANLLLMSMSEADYHEYGYLLDKGASFSKFTIAKELPGTQETVETVENSSEDTSLDWVKSFLSTSCLIWGNQGSGKSWLARYLMKEKSNLGYQLVVLDPNSNAYEWQGVRLINTYSGIESFMREYITELMNRYETFGKSNISEAEWRSQLWKDGKAISVLCEETSTYADFISDKELLAKFFKAALTLSRKQEMPILVVSHNNTQSCLGGISGLAKLIERTQQLQPLATVDSKSRQPISSGKGLLKIENSSEWLEVTLPQIAEKIRVFGNNESTTTANNESDIVENLEKLFNSSPKLSSGAASLLEYMTSTGKRLCTVNSLAPVFRLNNEKCSHEQIKSWLLEISNCGLADYDGKVLRLI